MPTEPASDLAAAIAKLCKEHSPDDVLAAAKSAAGHSSRKTHKSKSSKRASRPPPQEATAAVSDDMKAKAVQLFNLADKDKSGTIDEYELRELLRELFGEVSEPETNRIYQEMDRDHSGMITFDEFLDGLVTYQWNVAKVLEKKHHKIEVSNQFAWEIPASEIEMGESLGKGAYGEVRAAKWRGMDVAAKTLFKRNKTTDQIVDSFRKEVAIMGRLRHPNVLLFMGASTEDPEQLVMVMEYLEGGNITSVMERDDYTADNVQILKWAKQTALGLVYLHGCQILHRDLKTDNMLLDQHYNVKLCDFGLSDMKDELLGVVEHTGVGTPLYLAPELLRAYFVKPRKFVYNELTDVYSFGMCVWSLYGKDLLEDDPSFLEVQDITDLKRIIADEGKRPVIDNMVPVELAAVLRSCWEDTPSRRRQMSQLLADLDRILDDTINAVVEKPSWMRKLNVFAKNEPKAPKGGK